MKGRNVHLIKGVCICPSDQQKKILEYLLISNILVNYIYYTILRTNGEATSYLLIDKCFDMSIYTITVGNDKAR